MRFGIIMRCILMWQSDWFPVKMTYIFLDEVQAVPNFQKAVDSLFLRENTDIYITGSNAYLLSGEACNTSLWKIYWDSYAAFIFCGISGIIRSWKAFCMAEVFSERRVSICCTNWWWFHSAWLSGRHLSHSFDQDVVINESMTSVYWKVWSSLCSTISAILYPPRRSQTVWLHLDEKPHL